MKSCSLCSAPLDPAAGACPRCGIAAPRAPARRTPGPLRRALAGVALVALLGAAVTAAAPLVSALRGADRCEPESWADWHVAMKQECLTPEYVCANMTSATLFRDPGVSAAYRAAVEAGDRATAAHLEALVGHMRATYGCDGAGAGAEVHGIAPAPAHPRLPPGHPPIGPDRRAAPALPGGVLFEEPRVLEI